ncbi:MAG TPA: bifunctional RNase H/acid phosphatase [Mycobacteriales bacterium]|jgi:probable phosphoglycerate mutase|nr:bifunctional RNase H/acid phosphatase [Mycobacteriales bacterium]
MVDRVVVEADGGSRGNPGPAGYGAVVRDAESHEVLRETAGGIGVASNNVAEYRGLIAGLEAAVDLGARDVEVRMDSKLVVMQMSGEWKVKHPDMQVLARQAAALVRSLRHVHFQHIPREMNSHADRLANEAMDEQAAGREWRPRPSAPVATAPSRNTLYGWSAPAGPATVATILRHGETPLSVDKRFSGRGDAALTERGIAQAEAAAARLVAAGFTAIVSSPLRRTRQTAEIVAARIGAEVVVDDGFAETDFGEWEGATFGEIAKRSPDDLQKWLADPNIAPPGGESMVATEKRVVAARQRTIAAYPEQKVLVVTHVTPIKLMLRDALDAPLHTVFRIHIDPASISMVDWRGDGPSVVRLVNDISHLAGVATPFPG